MKHDTLKMLSLVSANQQPRGAGNAPSTGHCYKDLGRSGVLQICHGDELRSVSSLHSLQAYHFSAAELIDRMLRPVACKEKDASEGKSSCAPSW